MRGVKLLVVLLALMAAWSTTSTPAVGETMREYRLNPGDVVRISVWREEELLREARIQPDGTVSYPLVGSVSAADRTPTAVAETITQELEEFIPDAVVTVELLEARGYRVYVIGEVARPGEYQLSQPITALQALSIAGGLTPFAGSGGIRILRTQADEQMSIAFDYDAVADDGEMDKNIFLEAGDTVIVPASLF
ncbi:MAG: polysaccharide biosynthesis/export family protein [Alphaproteobacteria bacterium]